MYLYYKIIKTKLRIKMGKVRTILIKNVSKELISKYPDVFTTDFEENKKLLEKYLEIDSKHLRNRISGYLPSTCVERCALHHCPYTVRFACR